MGRTNGAYFQIETGEGGYMRAALLQNNEVVEILEDVSSDDLQEIAMRYQLAIEVDLSVTIGMRFEGNVLI